MSNIRNFGGAIKRAKIKAQGGYSAASNRRRVNRTWFARAGNSDTDDLPSLNDLRIKSRDAYRNQPVVTSGIDTILYNTIGAGLTLQSNPNHDVIGISAEEAAAWSRNVEFEFLQMWGASRDCDAERTKTWAGIQNVAFFSALVSGDVCALLPHIDRGGVYSMSVQLIEADRLSNPNGAMDTAETAGGITVGKYGDPIQYHFSKAHPGGLDMSREWVSIDAYGEQSGRPNVIHLCERKRPGQRRGVPLLAPVLEKLKVLDEYTVAELEAALISGLYTVFVKTESGELPDPVGIDEDVGDDELAMAPGAIVGLRPGEDIETANPGRPNQAFDPFVMSILKQIGAALQVPFELLLKHFSSSYSASRAALLEAWKAFRTRRRWFAQDFCQLVYEEWLYEAVLIGRVSAPGFLENPTIRRAYCMSDWNGPTPGQLDPEKETRAAKLRMEAYLSTGTKEAAEMNGTDYERNITVAARENALRQAAGPVLVGSDLQAAEETTQTGGQQ